jgi:glucokinase
MEHKFLKIYGVHMKDFFRKIPGVTRAVPISFVHDAHAVLSGELWKGNASGFPNAAVVTLGTGLGFAFSKNGKVQSDSLGSPLVTIFKLPYNGGILEDFTARRGILNIYRNFGGNSIEGIDVSDIGKRADDGDKISIQTFGEVGRILADALHNILIERHIQCLLLGGQISRSFRHIECKLRPGLSDVESLQRISVVKSIDNASFLGALRAIGNYSTNLSKSV